MGSRDPYSYAQHSLGFTGTWVGIACDMQMQPVCRLVWLNQFRTNAGAANATEVIKA